MDVCYGGSTIPYQAKTPNPGATSGGERRPKVRNQAASFREPLQNMAKLQNTRTTGKVRRRPNRRALLEYMICKNGVYRLQYNYDSSSCWSSSLLRSVSCIAAISRAGMTNAYKTGAKLPKRSDAMPKSKLPLQVPIT